MVGRGYPGDIELQGYRACGCGCGRQELLHVLHLTGGLAWECFRDAIEPHLRTIEVAHRNTAVTITLPPPRKRARKKLDRRETQRRAHAAREAARKRLAQLEPALYAVLYADERDKRGLPVVPQRVRAGAFAETVATKLAGLTYSDAADRGVLDADETRQTV